MNKYESVIIINPNLEEKKVKNLKEKFMHLINIDGKVTSIEDLGKRKLAYEIQKNNEGHYIVYKFEATPSLVSALEKNYRITDDIMKFITVKEAA